MASKTNKIKIKESIFRVLFMLAACVSIVAVIIICLFLLTNGLPAMHRIGWLDFLTGTTWKPGNEEFGILPMIVASIYVTAGALIIGVPLGLAAAVFMVFFCPKKLYKFFKPAVDLLAGIPSIVYGFFGLTALVPFMQKFGGGGKSVLTASILLGIMILPTMINVSEASLRAVPDLYYDGSIALGTAHELSILRVVIPAAKSGITAGVILATGRAIGETLAVSMVAGNQAVMPFSLLKGVRTLTANVVLEMGYAADLHREALIATAVVLFVFILLINICFSLIKKGDKAA
ncbi:MAG: phosphate ABC transporter permease subunit PstC [Eubacterium sp.]|jgi:phosphate transport system permease protein|nr:phosphate ABC transporter permease subunit PstC [Eubacterium sp.]